MLGFSNIFTIPGDKDIFPEALLHMSGDQQLGHDAAPLLIYTVRGPDDSLIDRYKG